MNEQNSEERWAIVPFSPRYRVSSLGRVQSRIGWRGRLATNESPWRDIKPFVAGRGYLMVGLRVGGESVREYVHRLVLLTFVGPCPPGMEARHILRNDRTDNRLDNLRWGTPLENAADCERHGTRRKGSQCHTAKYDEATVLKVRSLREVEGMTYKAIGELLGIHKGTVRNHCKRRNWRHLSA